MKIRLENHEILPEKLEPGVLYVSRTFSVSAHLCPCGCEDRVIVTLQADWQPSGWRYDEASVTLNPSILNTACPKRAHYYIRNGNVEWCEVPR